MVLWVVSGFLAAALVAVLVRPLLKPSRQVPGRVVSGGTEVYRSQLASLEADVREGLFAADEAEAARAEIARRLLAATREEAASAKGRELDGGQEATGQAAGRRGRLAAYGLMVVVPLASFGFYLYVGSPGLPDQPYAARIARAPEQASLGELVARVEAHLRQHPQDGRGWDVIAPVYLMGQRYDEAAEAFAKAIALLGESAKRLSGLAEARLRATNGIVDAAARRAFQRLIELEPGRAEAQFWLAMDKEQNGDKMSALAGYRALLATVKTDDPWYKAAEERIAVLEGKSEGNPGNGNSPAPAPSSPAPAAPPGAPQKGEPAKP